MRYRIKMMSKEELFITEAEFSALLTSEAKGLVALESLRGAVNLNSVESILPEDKITKKELTVGRLHDGSRVVKKFGNWVDADNPEVTIHPAYYPEVAKDRVWSEEEYQAVKDLPTDEKKKLIMGEEDKNILAGHSGVPTITETINRDELENYGIKPSEANS